MTTWVVLVGAMVTALGILWAARGLVIELRAQQTRLVFLLDRLESRVVVSSATASRIEAAAEIVAEDLAASHDRADTTEGPHGASADAAARSDNPQS